MAPSRGPFYLFSPVSASIDSGLGMRPIRRSIATKSQWAMLENNPRKRVHSFFSHSNNPYLNLSIEHFLLTESPHDSTILFIYTNRPSIIIGRNQNPWLEVNLNLLHAPWQLAEGAGNVPNIGVIDLVRRMSGGGTVFHDEGNVNWTVICPPDDFTRDKSAEMVVRALRRLAVERARVNERHDIVLDQGSQRKRADPDDTHTSPFSTERPSLKVSGSAYKLTRTRALHHGTCLLNSPNLNVIPQYLRSPTKPYMDAKGVGSVSSPISNIGLRSSDFIDALQNVFRQEHAQTENVDPQDIDSRVLEWTKVRGTVEQLKSSDWTYCQTPQFLVNVGMGGAIPQEENFDPSMHLKVRHGVIEEGDIRISSTSRVFLNITGKKLHEIANWCAVLDSASLDLPVERISEVAHTLTTLFPPVPNHRC